MDLKIVLFSLLMGGTWCAKLSFPPGFVFGASTSAFQVEGAWNFSDKSPSILDTYFQNNLDVGNGDIAADSFFQWRRDVEIAVELGLQFYRFSISWTRVLPTGFPDYISETGTTYYNNLIDELLKNGIEPVVTIFHFDLPDSIQKLDGWLNPQIADWFADYARVLYTLFGDRVKIWNTINEPIMLCYSISTYVFSEDELDPYLCTKNTLLAHAKAWRVYDKEFKPLYHGKLSIPNHLAWYLPKTEKDEELAELSRQFEIGMYSHPIYSKEGGWPKDIERIIIEFSEQPRCNQTLLPLFSDEEVELVRGTYDYYAVNYYTARLVRPATPYDEIGLWPYDGSVELNAIFEISSNWNVTVDDWLALYPEGIRYVISWVKKQYGDLEFFITENGFPTTGGLTDDDRIQFYEDSLYQVKLAIAEGANVIGYTAWALIDNMEFNSGYQIKFGLYEVDFASPNRTRTPRKSASFYRGLTDAARSNLR